MARAHLFAIYMALGSISAACHSHSSPSVSAGGVGVSGVGVSGAGASSVAAAPVGALAVAGSAAALPPAMGTPGVWEEVTSPNMDPTLFNKSNFGIGSIVADPARPTDLYVGGYGSLWKSSDYGLNWSKLDSKPNPPSLALGHVLAVAGTTPATLWMASVYGEKHVYKSTDAGRTFTLTGTIPEQPDAASLYSIVVDPNDATHLLSGLHEQDKVLESSDGGATWRFASGNGWPSGGKSWFPYFVRRADAASTRATWFAIGQDGGSPVISKDAGKTWSTPAGLEGLQHPHGGAGLYQNGTTLFVAGIGAKAGSGVYRSTDLGEHWTRVAEGSGGIVWGSTKNLYAMWGWACAGCGQNEGGAQYQTAAQPGDTWSKGSLPTKLDWGPNSVASTSDGKHAIFVGSMWTRGLWRFVEP